jgi:hypothetical protein
VLVKGIGAQNTYGAINHPNIIVDTTSAKKPGKKVLNRIQEQKQLRIDIERETSGGSAVSSYQ